MAQMREHLRLTAEQLHLPFSERTKTYNSRLAQELGLWATDKGKGEEFHTSAFHAYFAHGLNLADHQVLLDLVRTVGLSEDEAEKVLLKRTYARKVDKDWEDARLQGITAVPTFVIGRQRLVGAHSYENLSEWVSFYGAVRKKG